MSGTPDQLNDNAAIAALQVEVQHLVDAVKALDREVGTLTAQANRWKGAFLVILAVGGALGSVGTFIAGRMLK